MTFETLVATMGKTEEAQIAALLQKMNIDSDCVVVRQCGIDAVETINYNNHRVKTIYSKERGVK